MKMKRLKRLLGKNYLRYGVKLRLAPVWENFEHSQVVFDVQIMSGTKVADFFKFAPDVKHVLRLPELIPYKEGSYLRLRISIEQDREKSLTPILKSRDFQECSFALPIVLGYKMEGKIFIADLVRLPHVLYAGTTGSGKSVGLACLILSLLCRQSAKDVNLILIDTGTNDFGIFDGISLLSHSVVHDIKTGIFVMEKLVMELERRVHLTDEELAKLPFVVCVVDEVVSFVEAGGNKRWAQRLTGYFSDISRRGRHGKVHLVLATQDPTTKTLRFDTGNIVARLAFRCARCQNSVAIIGEGGAEKLVGQGRFLYKSSQTPHPICLQGAFVSKEQVGKVVDFFKGQDQIEPPTKFVIPEEVRPEVLEDSVYLDTANHTDEEFAKIILWTLGNDAISANQLAKAFHMGNRSRIILEQLFECGLIDAKNAKQPRIVLPQSVEDIPPDVGDLLSNYYDRAIIEEVFARRRKGNFVERMK